jgi:hypothetical protein
MGRMEEEDGEILSMPIPLKLFILAVSLLNCQWFMK